MFDDDEEDEEDDVLQPTQQPNPLRVVKPPVSVHKYTKNMAAMRATKSIDSIDQSSADESEEDSQVLPSRQPVALPPPPPRNYPEPEDTDGPTGMAFTTTQEQDMVEWYASHPKLYNHADPEFMDKIKKDRLISKKATDLGCTGEFDFYLFILFILQHLLNVELQVLCENVNIVLQQLSLSALFKLNIFLLFFQFATRVVSIFLTVHIFDTILYYRPCGHHNTTNFSVLTE